MKNIEMGQISRASHKKIRKMIGRSELSIENSMITCRTPTTVLTHELAADLATHRIALLQLKNIYEEDEILIVNENGDTKYTDFAQELFWDYFIHFVNIINTHKA